MRTPTVCPECGFNTQPPEGGWYCWRIVYILTYSFNTQPPEGGWILPVHEKTDSHLFQHTAARRRLVTPYQGGEPYFVVSTHSRPKAAGSAGQRQKQSNQFQHTAARRRLGRYYGINDQNRSVSTHSRPKAAGSIITIQISK